MVDTLGLPTVFFTHSAADLQWSELASLIADDTTSPSSRSEAVTNNPAVADWFFHHRFQKYLKEESWKQKIFGFDTNGSTEAAPHVHGVAWLPNAPKLEEYDETGQEQNQAAIIQYIDSLISTNNPAISSDGSNADDAPRPQTNPHICNISYTDVTDFDDDLAKLIATCQRHTRCSTTYCLRTKHGKQQCRFGYPKQIQLETMLDSSNEDLEVTTQRNDPLINSFNKIQLS